MVAYSNLDQKLLDKERLQGFIFLHMRWSVVIKQLPALVFGQIIIQTEFNGRWSLFAIKTTYKEI